MMKKFKKKLRLVKYTEVLPNDTEPTTWYEIQKNWICGFIPSKFHIFTLCPYILSDADNDRSDDELKYYDKEAAIAKYNYCLKYFNITPSTVKTEVLKENTKDS